jgi:drug/metabolite transporter (DMT)-like permease
MISKEGQLRIICGCKYNTARAGSLVSTSRILYAVILGMLVFGEAMTWQVFAGGVLIMMSIVTVTILSKPEKEP